MPALTQQMASKYYDTLSAEQKAAVDASGGPTVAWLQGAVNAGVPAAINATGMAGSTPEGNQENETGDAGNVMDWTDAADPSEWMGKRKPTPGELRKWAQDQNLRYNQGEQGVQDEDYARFSDRVLAGLIKKTWDTSGGGWKPGGGNPWSTYDDSGKVLEGPGGAKGKGGPGGPGGAGQQAAPVDPTTYTEGDKALSYTGSPLVDNMINMFNTAQSQRAAVGGGVDVDRADLGAFARGENQQVGGGDDLSKLAGMLMGTGNNAFLWTAVDDEAFGGMEGQWSGEQAKKKKKRNRGSVGPSVSAIADPSPPPVDQTTQEVVAPGGPRIPTYKQEQIDSGFNYKQEYFGEQDSPMSRMLGNNSL